MSKKKKDPMVTIIGVPTNSSGKIDGVARAPSALRRAGLIDVLSDYCDVHDYGDVLFSQPILGYFGFDKTVYGGDIRKNRKWWHELREERIRGIEIERT
jgi:arginase family enzyme